MRLLLMVLMLGLVLPAVQEAQAAPCEGDDARCFQPKIMWRIKNNHIYKPCYNYDEHSPQKRKCMVMARQVIKQRCSDYLELASQPSNSKGAQERNLRMVDRFCSPIIDD